MCFFEEKNADQDANYKNHCTDDIREQERICIEQCPLREHCRVVLAGFGKSSSDQRTKDRSMYHQPIAKLPGGTTYPKDHTKGMMAYAEAMPS